MPELHRLIESAYRGEAARAGWTHEADLVETPRTSAEALTALIEDPDQLILLLLGGQRILGCVQLTRATRTAAYLGMLAVQPSRQASGAGRRLIAAAEAEAVRRFGAETMEMCVISSRRELIAYYQRRGYALTGEERPFPVELNPPLTLAVLAKPLGSNGSLP